LVVLPSVVGMSPKSRRLKPPSNVMMIGIASPC
jgi:hypothetical protein